MIFSITDLFTSWFGQDTFIQNVMTIGQRVWRDSGEYSYMEGWKEQTFKVNKLPTVVFKFIISYLVSLIIFFI